MLLPRDEADLKEAFTIASVQLHKYCLHSFWLPIVRSKQNYTQWENANNGSKTIEYLSWGFGQPNGYPTQNCVGAQVSISSTLNARILHTNVLFYVRQSQNVNRKAAKKDFRTKNSWT